MTTDGEAQARADDDRAQRANWLRAGVLGANDGVVSVAAIVVGVAGATAAATAILVAGLAALIGGAVSMALGEYVSVSSQRDLERAGRGGAADPSDASPWAAAAASALSFTTGGIVPLLAMTLTPPVVRIPITVVAVVVALAAAGALGARLGGAAVGRATLRTVVGGMLALALTFGIGRLFHAGGVTA